MNSSNHVRTAAHKGVVSDAPSGALNAAIDAHSDRAAGLNAAGLDRQSQMRALPALQGAQSAAPNVERSAGLSVGQRAVPLAGQTVLIAVLTAEPIG